MVRAQLGFVTGDGTPPPKRRPYRGAKDAKSPIPYRDIAGDLWCREGPVTRDDIAIHLYYEDHPPPHIHARYGEHQAKVSIVTHEVMEGSLPRRAGRLVLEWVSEHTDELAACWEKATHGEEPGTIEPLQ